VPLRGRLRWSVPLARLATPAVLVAAGLSLGPAQGPSVTSARPTADAHPMTYSAALQPFAATPRVVSLVVRTVVVRHTASPAAPPAAPPAVAAPPVIAGATPGIPARVLAAYVNAADRTTGSDPSCKLTWQMLAGIGFVESDNAASGGSGNPNWNGVANPPIYGPLLDGKHGRARVPDTDHGKYDHDRKWDRAVGPMQIMPSTWAVYAADGNDDGIANPQDIDDASVAAADYLCATAQHLDRPKHLIRAIYTYNHSYTYVKSVLAAIAGYLHINPAKLGINGLPKRHLIHMRILPPPAAAKPNPKASPPSVPKPTAPWPLKPTPSASPKPLPKR
jgi:membrane-bound lytic murein transglycosylase B